MQNLIDLGFGYHLSNFTIILFSLIFVMGCDSNHCGNFAVDLKNHDIKVCFDTSLLDLKFDSSHTYLEQQPYVVRFVSRSNDVFVYTYIASPDELVRLGGIYTDLEENYGSVEEQNQNDRWIKYVSKDKFYANNSTFYFVEYFNEKSSWIEAEMVNNESLHFKILITNNVLQNANQDYVDNVKKFLKSIHFNKK